MLKKINRIIFSIILILSLCSYNKSDTIKLKFEIRDKDTSELVLFPKVKISFNKTKGSKTYNVNREKTFYVGDKYIMEIEKEIFINQQVIIELSANTYNTIIQEVVIDKDVMNFKFEMSRIPSY